MNRLFLFKILFSLLLFSCTNEELEVGNKFVNDRNYFKENIAFLDARIRGISQEEFVKEIVLKDFSSLSKLPPSIGFEEGIFSDDGLINDLIAGDGIYTSKDSYSYTKSLASLTKGEIKSVLDEVVIDKSFKHRDQLNSTLKVKDQDADNQVLESRGPVATIECDVEFGTKGCYAQKWGWCDSCCVTVSNCRVKIGWE